MSNAEYQREYRRKKKAKAKGYIYALIDPRDSRIRYIGRTYQPQIRSNSHVQRSQPIPLARRQWQNELLNLGLTPLFVIVEVVAQEQYVEREKFWINRLQVAGANLLNERLTPHGGKRKGSGRKAST